MKFNWKDILKWLAVVLAAIGGNQAYETATAPEPAPAEYAVSNVDEGWQPGTNYRIKASFYQLDKIKVGNFSDVYQEDDIETYVVYVSNPSDASVITAYEKETGREKVAIRKVISRDKRPGLEEPDLEEPDIE